MKDCGVLEKKEDTQLTPNEFQVVHPGKDAQEELEFPEGGKGWLVICGTGLATMMGYGMINSFSVYQTYYKTTLYPGTSSQSLSLIGASQASMLYILNPIFAPLMYVIGIRIQLIIGCTLVIISFFGLSTATEDSIWKLYFFQAVMFSIGNSLAFVAVIQIPTEWFRLKRATAYSISFVFSCTAGIMWPLLFKHLIPKYGFKWTNLIFAFMFIPIGVLIVILTPQRLNPQYIHRAETLSNSTFDLEKIKNLHHRIIANVRNWRPVLKDWRFLIFLLSNIILGFGVFPAIFYMDYFGDIIGPNDKIVTYIVMIYNAVGAPGRVMPAMLADKFGRVNIILIWLFMSGASILTFWIASVKTESMSLYLAFVVLYGFFVGPYFSLAPACLGQLFGHTEGSEARFGLYLLSMAPGPLVGCVIAGSFVPVESHDKIQLLDSFYKLTAFTGVMIVAGTLALLVVRLSFTRKVFTYI